MIINSNESYSFVISAKANIKMIMRIESELAVLPFIQTILTTEFAEFEIESLVIKKLLK